jgi:lysyl-tRNA synthetase class I
MNLKNYTTEVPASRSQEYIEKLLVQFGAHNIMKEYVEIAGLPGKRCATICFIIDVGEEKLPFRLDARVEQVRKWLRKKKPNSTDKTVSEQAERIAWKQQYEMLHLQLGQIEISQLETMEVFFPYLYNPASKKTYYETVKEGSFRALLNSPT